MDNKAALISVIVPIYNAQDFLEETILSVLNQTYSNIEVILVNHASTDNTENIIQKHAANDKRIVVIDLKINKGGPAYPRNEGLKQAKGEYIAFVDSDDVWLENKLEIQLATLIEKGVDIVHSGAYIINSKSEVVKKFNNQKVRRILKLFLKDKSIIYIDNFININSVLMKVDKSIRFKEDREFVAVEDWGFWMSCFEKGKTFFYDKSRLINYRVHMGSISNRSSDKQHRKAILLLAHKMYDKDELSRLVIYLGMARHFLMILLKYFFRILKKN